MKIKNVLEKYSKYLPSRKFIKIIAICFVVIVGLFIFFRISAKEKFISQAEKNALIQETGKLTINELVLKDSDSDGIPDWEEALWGTDKNNRVTFNNTPDATYIQNKKIELGTEQTPSDENLTETDKFSREFFAAFMSMKESGQVDNTTINNFSNALGQQMIDPLLIDLYTEQEINISTDNSTKNQEKYYSSMKKLFEGYKSTGLGDELDIVSSDLSVYSALGTGTQSKELQIIADAYQDFAKKAIRITVPSVLAQYHLQIINSSNNTGISVRNMAKTIVDPIIGLSGLSQYQKYSGELVGAVADMEAAMQ
ncbi:MAG: hypothetical protein WAV23_03700 [Minisyncoccia bacterium]